jgi:hypothetical protein
MKVLCALVHLPEQGVSLRLFIDRAPLEEDEREIEQLLFS